MLKIASTAKVTVGGAARGTLHSILTWDWTRKLLHWVIISAGTISECAFLVASLWMSINSSVHPLVLLFMSEQSTRHLSELATAAYVALPECILPLASVIVISHVRMWLYRGKGWNVAAIWSVLFGLPTVIFLLLSLITLGCSVASVSFIMPEPLIVVRALAGYMFAFVSLLYARIGLPQERDRLTEKDATIAELRQQNESNLNSLQQEHAQILTGLRQQNETAIAELRQQKEMMVAELGRENQMLQSKLEFQNREIETQKALLTETKSAHRQLLDELDKSEETALQAYSDECIAWLKSGVKTATVDEITRYTGHSKRKIENAITRSNLQTAPRNRELILVSSLVSWLRNNPPASANTPPVLHVMAG